MKKNILITGSNGFIGKNLIDHLKNLKNFTILEFNRENSHEFLLNQINKSDLVIHLAGVNRSHNKKDFLSVNVNLTEKICEYIKLKNKKIPILFSSSSQVNQNTEYGQSKVAAEKVLINLYHHNGNPIVILRLHGIFGKYCRPNYNSVVATFCHNIINNLPLNLIDPQKVLSLIYIDDLISNLIKLINQDNVGLNYIKIEPEFKISVGELAKLLYQYKDYCNSLYIGNVSSGFSKALFATFTSYLKPEQFSYPLVPHNDTRGSFVEVMKNKNFGQISYLIVKPGMTRGGHYHHTKCERFIVVNGLAKFRFVHTLTKESYEINVSGDSPTLVQTIPGWAHDLTNNGADDLIAIIWSNELFDSMVPDTVRFDI